MFSLLEQRFLLELLKAKRTGGTFRRGNSYFYKTMRSLERNDYAKIVSKSPLTFEITVLGMCLASLIAKHDKTVPGFKKYAGTVEMYLLK